jgi:hypothetical protein
MAERTGCPIILSLWSYVVDNPLIQYILLVFYVIARDFIHRAVGQTHIRGFIIGFLGSQNRICRCHFFDNTHQSRMQRFEHADLQKPLPKSQPTVSLDKVRAGELSS